MKTVSGQQLPRTSWEKIKNFQIPVPPLSEQKKLVTSIEKIEEKIKQVQTTLENAPHKKEQILDKYLK